MSKLLDSFLNGLAGSSGKSISDGLSDVSKGLKQIKQEIAEIIVKSDATDSLNAEILTYFCENIKSIEIEPLTSHSEYNDILKWAAHNRCGDRLYLVRHDESKNKATMIFVFFGQGEDLLLDDTHPQRCYIATELPNSIKDLFAEKFIFVQPFK